MTHPRESAGARRRSARTPTAAVLLAATTVLVALSGCTTATSDAPTPPHPSLIPALEARIADEDGLVEVMARLGAAYREAGRLDEAREMLQRAVELDPRSGASVFFLGVTYEDLEAWGEARETYERFLALGSGELGARDAIEGRLPRVRRLAAQAEARRIAAREAELADLPPRPDAIAVVPFRFEGSDPVLAPLASALGALLATDLAQTDRLTVLERLRIDALLDEIALGASDRVAPETAARGGRLLGAGHIVVGSLAGTEASVEVEGLLVDASQTGAPGQPISESDPVAAIIDAEKRMALAIFERLGIELTPAERERVNERPTENVQALLAYGLGVDAELRGDFEAASAQYQRAAQLDPGFQAAVEGSERASGAAEAADRTTASVAAAGAAGLFEGDALDDWLVRRSAYATLESIVPRAGERDPAAEAFILEGLVRQAIFDLVIPLPGR